MPITYCFSTDEERYQGDYATREEAEAAAWDYLGGDDADQETVWTGESHAVHYSELLPAGDGLAEMALERMTESAREIYEDSDWPEVDEEEQAALAKLLDAAVEAWAEQHLTAPTIFRVERIRPHNRPAPKPERGGKGADGR